MKRLQLQKSQILNAQGIANSAIIFTTCLPLIQLGKIYRSSKKMTKYLWWKSCSEALEDPERVVAQVMNIRDYADVCAVAHEIGESGFREVLLHAEPGEFDIRSWHYWHYRLGLAKREEVPPLPSRKFPG